MWESKLIKLLLEDKRIRIIFKSIGKAILWTILTTLMGCIQILLIWFVSFLIKETPIDLKVIFYDGIPLYYSMAVVFGITIDYYFSDKINYGKTVEFPMFIIFPFFLLIFSSFTITMIYLGKDTIFLNQLKLFNYIIISFTIMYALIGKTLQYITEQRG